MDQKANQVYVLRLCYETRTDAFVEIEKPWEVREKDLKSAYKRYIFDNTDSGRISCMQYSWVLQTLQRILRRKPGGEMRVVSATLKDGDTASFTYGKTFYCDMTFIVADGIEYRFMGKPGSPITWATHRENIRVDTSIRLILLKYREEFERAERMFKVKHGNTGSSNQQKIQNTRPVVLLPRERLPQLWQEFLERIARPPQKKSVDKPLVSGIASILESIPVSPEDERDLIACRRKNRNTHFDTLSIDSGYSSDSEMSHQNYITSDRNFSCHHSPKYVNDLVGVMMDEAISIEDIFQSIRLTL